VTIFRPSSPLFNLKIKKIEKVLHYMILSYFFNLKIKREEMRDGFSSPQIISPAGVLLQR
jgi:hypothetical protein